MARFKEIEFKLENTEAQLRLVQRISRFMARDLHLGEALEQVVSHVVEFMECDSCLLYVAIDKDLVLVASNNPQPGTIGNVRLKLGEGLTGWVAQQRRLLSVSKEAYMDPRFKLFTDLPEDTYEAFLSAPLVSRNRMMGVINVQHKEGHEHSSDEIALVTFVGEQMGGVIARKGIYEAFMKGPEHGVELFHGYTYSAHPLACAAGLATLDTYADDQLLTRASHIGGHFAEALHSLGGEPHVIDVRNYGLMAGIELAPRTGKPGARAFDAFLRCYEKGVLVRVTGDIIALSPPLIAETKHLDQLTGTIAEVLKTLD